jgi:hypothetical protein
MTSDVLTKYLLQEMFERHTRVFCGEDEYMKKKNKVGNLQVAVPFVVHDSCGSYF